MKLEHSPAARLALALSLVLAGVAVVPAAAQAQAQAPAPARPATPRPAVAAPAAAPPAAPEGVVNINTATEEELTRLPLVGPARAAAILALRTRLQRFRSADELVRVRGIGRVSMRRLRPFVVLAGDTTLQARPGARRAGEEGVSP